MSLRFKLSIHRRHLAPIRFNWPELKPKSWDHKAARHAVAVVGPVVLRILASVPAPALPEVALARPAFYGECATTPQALRTPSVARSIHQEKMLLPLKNNGVRESDEVSKRSLADAGRYREGQDCHERKRGSRSRTATRGKSSSVAVTCPGATPLRRLLGSLVYCLRRGEERNNELQREVGLRYLPAAVSLRHWVIS